jgi:hypothetical protein
MPLSAKGLSDPIIISDPDVGRVPAEYEIGVKKPEQISCRVTLLTSGAF